VDEAALVVHPDVDFQSKVPMLALTGLVHLRIPLPLFILRGAWSLDDGGIDDRALLHGHAVGLEVSFARLKDLRAQILLLQQMPERQERGLIRDPVGDQGDAGKAAHRCYLDQRVLHGRIAEVVPLLQQMDPQHGLQWIRRPTALAAGLVVVGLDQIDQLFPRHNRFHLSQEELAPGIFLAVDCS